MSIIEINKIDNVIAKKIEAKNKALKKFPYVCVTFKKSQLLNEMVKNLEKNNIIYVQLIHAFEVRFYGAKTDLQTFFPGLEIYQG